MCLPSGIEAPYRFRGLAVGSAFSWERRCGAFPPGRFLPAGHPTPGWYFFLVLISFGSVRDLVPHGILSGIAYLDPVPFQYGPDVVFELVPKGSADDLGDGVLGPVLLNYRLAVCALERSRRYRLQ